jgi:peptidyl-prolyl cis-trans isomerase A (cyclophilin A)
MTTRSPATVSTIVIILALLTMAHVDADSRLVAPGPSSEKAPDAFAVRFETTKGAFVVEAYRPWAPQAVDRFYNLVRTGYLDGNLFYRVLQENGVDFGISSDPDTTKAWRKSTIPCDPPRRKIRAGDVFLLNSGFGEGAATEIRIQTGADGSAASQTGAAALGRIVEGIEILASLDSSHMQDTRKWPKMVRTLVNDGEAAVRKEFPKIDSIVHATLLERTVEIPVEEPAVAAGAPAVPAGMALVRVYRADPSKQKFTLRIDGSPKGVLLGNTVYETTLPAGRHEFSTKVKFKMFATGIGDKLFATRDEIAEELRAGGVYHLRSLPTGDGRTLQLYLVANDFGAEECKNLAPAKPLEGTEEE